MIAVWNELHTFLIYAVLGYALIYPLALLCLRLFSIDHPGQRRQFYVLAMLSPMIGFVLYHTIFMTRCQVELIQARVEGEALLLLCMVADRALHIAAPILIVLIILGLGKALTAAILVRRLRFKAVKPYHGISNRVEFILGRRCASIGLGIPEIIYSNRAGFAAFTAGLFKPVLVLGNSLIEELTEQELDALLTHELVHIKHKDNLNNWLLFLLRNLTFFNPISSILMRQILFETERICDREAVLLTGQKPEAYAAVLLRVWKLLLKQKPLRGGLVSAFTGRMNDMEYRVTALLKNRNKDKRIPALIFQPIVLLFTVTALLYLGLIC